MSEKSSVQFLLQTDDTVGDFFEQHADTFRTIRQLAVKKNKTLTVDNFLEIREEVSLDFKNKLLDIACSENAYDLLLDFVKDFMLSPDSEEDDDNEDTDDDNSVEESSLNLATLQPKAIDTNNKVEVIYKREERDEEPKSVDHSLILNKCHQEEHGGESNILQNQQIKWLKIPAIAVEENNFEIIKLCAITGWCLQDFRTQDDSTLLSLAVGAERLNFEMIDFLLKHIDLNVAADKGKTTLHTCLYNGSISGDERYKLLQLLIEHGADSTRMSEPAGSPLHAYILTLQFVHTKDKICQWRSIFDTLLKSGVDLNSLDWFGHSILSTIVNSIPNEDDPFIADMSNEEALEVRKTKIEILKYLLQRGANPNTRDNGGRTSLHHALIAQNPDVVEFLIEQGADVNAQTYAKASPVYYLCNQVSWEDEHDVKETFLPLLKILCKSNCDLNLQAVDGSTVLHFASVRLTETICRALIEAGAKLDFKDYLHRTPLHMASRNMMHPGVSALLIKFGAEINQADVNGATPLQTACLFGNTEVVRILLEYGANVSQADELGIQPIHLAAENGDEMMLEQLLLHKADIHALDNWNATPLHYAASDGNYEAAEYLLKRGADKYKRDEGGRIPLDFSKFRGQYKACTVLADNPEEVKFGKFPQDIFPNRPLLKPEQVDGYFESIKERIQNMGSTTEEISEAILNSPGIGQVDMQEGENKQIFEAILQHAQAISIRIGELDPAFKCSLHNAGSTSEGVKIGYADEFDFVCHLEEFSSFIERVEKEETPEYARILMKSPLPDEYKRFCIRSSEYINAASMLKYFHKLAKRAMFDVLSKSHRHLYAGLSLLHHHEGSFDETIIPLAKLQGFDISWRGRDHKILDVSVDINPVLFTRNWPDEAIKECKLLPNISEFGMYLIPKYCKAVTALPDQMVPMSSDLWRYSTHHVEASIMKNLQNETRNAYILCKAFRMEPLTCGVEVPPAPSAFSEEQIELLFPNSHTSRNYTVECEEGAAVDRHLKNLDVAHPHNIAMNISVQADNDDDRENIFHGNENEVTAESVIPSYHLKTLFLKEVDSIVNTTGTIPDVGDTLHLALKIYQELLKAVESEHMTTLFFPTYEIYRQASHSGNPKAAKELRYTFCRNILSLLKTLSIKQNVN